MWPGFTDWSPEVIQAMFSKPALSNLSAAAVDLITNHNRLIIITLSQTAH